MADQPKPIPLPTALMVLASIAFLTTGLPIIIGTAHSIAWWVVAFYVTTTTAIFVLLANDLNTGASQADAFRVSGMALVLAFLYAKMGMLF